MKKILPLLLAAVAALPVLAAEIGVIDIAEVIQAHPDTPANKQALETTKKGFEEQRDARMAELKKLRDEVAVSLEQANNDALSEKARLAAKAEGAAKYKRLQEEEAAFRKLVSELQESLAKQEAAALKATLKSIAPHIEALAKERGFSVILESSGLVTPSSVLWSSKSVDITGDVIGRVKAAVPAEGEAAPETAGNKE